MQRTEITLLRDSSRKTQLFMFIIVEPENFTSFTFNKLAALCISMIVLFFYFKSVDIIIYYIKYRDKLNRSGTEKNS